jgi:crossover junction endodeoxyribonuclease RuvC
MVILGIDPGFSRIGYGAILKKGAELNHIASGLFGITKETQAERLITIEQEILKLINNLQPTRIGLEKLFFFRNQKTAIGVAEARGVILNTIKKTGVPFFEFTPLEIKIAVTGDGSASKEAVAKMVKLFLKLPDKKVIDDVSDALAIAITASRKIIK